MADNLDDAIRKNAQGPAKAARDAGSVEQHKLTEQIAADRYLGAKQAPESKRRGLAFKPKRQPTSPTFSTPTPRPAARPTRPNRSNLSNSSDGPS